MLARGINVCVGTDSVASTPDLDPLEDLRLLARHADAISAGSLLELVTTRAARALRLSDRGALITGARADFAVYPSTSSDPLKALLQEQIRCTSTWVAGVQRYQLTG
jgi:cytosine/adenosine deaminase-related metal-dependent hydrolase